jgi:peptide/nickel transport system permease protein
MFSMIMVGARVSIAVAFVAVGIGMISACRWGSMPPPAGQPARRDHHARQRSGLCLPSAVLAIMITAVFGPGAINAIIAIGIFNIPVFARVARCRAVAVDPGLHAGGAGGRQGSRRGSPPNTSCPTSPTC